MIPDGPAKPMSTVSENALSPVDADENILLIRLKSIGDIVFTLPAVAAVRENYPQAKITFLVSREHAPLIAGFKDVNRVIELDRALYRRLNPTLMVREALSLLGRLRREKFSLVVDFQGYGETALLTWCTRARQRWGSVYKRGRSRAYTRGVNRNSDIHPVEWNLSLLQQCGLRTGRIRNEFILPDAPLAEARRLFAAENLAAGKPVLFLQPFTSAPKKNWPLESYLVLARHWQGRGVQVLFGGGPADRPALEPARQAGFPVFAGAPLLVAAGLMKLSTLILGGDTGLLHLAVAMDKRVVMLMASDASERPYPFQHMDWTVTPSLGRVAGIAPGAVIEASARAFAELDHHISG
jgi:ADP-heptose:LPS heptosyltransferase